MKSTNPESAMVVGEHSDGNRDFSSVLSRWVPSQIVIICDLQSDSPTSLRSWNLQARDSMKYGPDETRSYSWLHSKTQPVSRARLPTLKPRYITRLVICPRGLRGYHVGLTSFFFCFKLAIRDNHRRLAVRVGRWSLGCGGKKSASRVDGSKWAPSNLVSRLSSPSHHAFLTRM